MALQLIVGLGNPGPEYANTRHNAGAQLVMALAQSCGAQFTDEAKFNGLTARVIINNQAVRLLLPTTYMNNSGQAVGPLANFYKIPAEDILVVHDELDLPPGTARLKQGGSGGGNGIKDVIRSLGNQKNFKRLRIGIGHPGTAALVSAYVLKKAPADEQQLIDGAIGESLKIIPAIVADDWEKAMRELHTNT